MFILDLSELLLGQVFRLALLGHKLPVRYAIEIVTAGYYSPFVHFLCPPAQTAHPVLDGARGKVLFEPQIHQGLDMLLLKRRGFQLSESEVVQLVGDSAQLALPAHPGFEAAFVTVFA